MVRRAIVVVLTTAVPAYAAPGQASALAEAQVRAAEFDLMGAATLLKPAAERGDASAQVAEIYVRGLIDAREAARQGGSPESLAPVREAIASLEAIAKGRPGSAEIARLVLQAAAAAAQSEREEMRLYLETALRMEALQHAAGMPGAPLIPAAETAGDLWLQVHQYDEARKAYDDAAAFAEVGSLCDPTGQCWPGGPLSRTAPAPKAEQPGASLRALAGRARAARGANDVPAACTAFRTLLEAWGARARQPIEITEARAYVAGSCPSR